MIRLDEHTQIEALRWYNTPRGSIGFVLLVNDTVAEAPYYKVYVGIGDGLNENTDARYIADYGSPLLDEDLARELADGRQGDRAYRR